MERYYAAYNTPIFLGFVGEDEAREIAFDVSGWKEKYGGGVIQLMARRPAEDTMYPVHLTEEGPYVIWTVRGADVAVPGQSGLCELSLADGGRIVKSGRWTTYVYTAMGTGAKYPNPVEQSWLDSWREEVAGVKADAERAEECAAYILAALEDENYNPEWLNDWRQENEEARGYAAAAEESATEAAMSVSQAATRASLAAESARIAAEQAALVAELVASLNRLGGSELEILKLVRDLLCKAVYTEDVSSAITQLDELLAACDQDSTVTLERIAVSYTGGSAAVGTSVDSLTGVTVVAFYSDDSSETVTEYELSGEIAEGYNTVTVSYGGKTAEFAVEGIVEEVTLEYITASYGGGSVSVGTSLDSLNGVTVMAFYSDGSNETVTDYSLSGSVREGSNVITASYGGETATFTVVGVAEDEDEEITLLGISASYTGGSVAVGTAVTDLTGVTVTAFYSDDSSFAVTGYTISGTIAEGSNTVTVSYGGKTASFVVTGVAAESDEESDGETDGGTADDGDGHVVITDSGVSASDDGSGNVTVYNMTASDDGSGTITVS